MYREDVIATAAAMYRHRYRGDAAMYREDAIADLPP